MKVSKFPKPLTRKYLRLAAVYRRFAGRKSGFDFSLKALLDCQAHESRGIKAEKDNGYLFGKWAKDISVATWREDIVAGHFCKAEFHTPLDKWWAEPALESVVVPMWFPYNKETYDTKDKKGSEADVILAVRNIIKDRRMAKIRLREGKVTKKYVKGLDTNTLVNVLNWNVEYEDCRKVWYDHMQASFWKAITAETIARWGKPNVVFAEYESSPGLWMIDDKNYGITWMVWSDLHHKNPWKGTSFELMMPEKLSGEDMKEALSSFIEFLK